MRKSLRHGASSIVPLERLMPQFSERRPGFLAPCHINTKDSRLSARANAALMVSAAKYYTFQTLLQISCLSSVSSFVLSGLLKPSLSRKVVTAIHGSEIRSCAARGPSSVSFFLQKNPRSFLLHLYHLEPYSGQLFNGSQREQKRQR